MLSGPPTLHGDDTPLDLAVVVLNYNGGSLLRQVVRAVQRSRDLRVGVVVVDNGSTDTSMDDLARDLQAQEGEDSQRATLLLRTGANLGYAAGNNLGLFALPARYIALLNNDALVEPDTLGTLIRFMDRYPMVAACAPRLVWPDGRPQPFSHGHDPTPTYLIARARARRRGLALHDWGPHAPRPVDWVAGTCAVIRPQALATTGLLDQGIFMYFEDNDLCLRLRQRGWQVYFVPEVAVRHYNRPSYSDRTRLRNYYQGLGRFYRKHYGLAPGLIMQLLGRLQLLRRS